MNLPDFMIHQSFRYVLGRRTYAVQEWCDWCVENWNKIPESEQNIIIRELEESFKLDSASKSEFFKPLGDECDKVCWERVRKLYT
jgi:hypothetical protein